MPIYEYKCSNCSIIIKELMNDLKKTITCPNCKGTANKIVSNVNFVGPIKQKEQERIKELYDIEASNTRDFVKDKGSMWVSKSEYIKNIKGRRKPYKDIKSEIAKYKDEIIDTLRNEKKRLEMEEFYKNHKINK